MGRRRELESRLALFSELSGIVGAMRNLALAELHRATRREEAARRVVQILGDSLVAVTGHDIISTAEPGPGPTIWLLFGSQRGFCGGFNEAVRATWASRHRTGDAAVVIGERLMGLLEDAPGIIGISGADTVLEAVQVVDRIVTACSALTPEREKEPGLAACVHGQHGTNIIPLLPLQPGATPGVPPAPLLNEPAPRVAGEISRVYFYHRLVGLVLASLCHENRRRLMQMDSALKHINETSDGLHLLNNRLRQEEIVEEIENVLGALVPIQKAVEGI